MVKRLLRVQVGVQLHLRLGQQLKLSLLLGSLVGCRMRLELVRVELGQEMVVQQLRRRLLGFREVKLSALEAKQLRMERILILQMSVWMEVILHNLPRIQWALRGPSRLRTHLARESLLGWER